VTILFVSVTTWIRGVCQHIDTTGKNPVVPCPFCLFKHYLSCKYFHVLDLGIITLLYLARFYLFYLS
jgi:hypothetical protein